MKKQFYTLLLVIVTTGIGLVQNATAQWSLSGNSNATTSSKLGTTNNIPLRLYTNNTVRLHINGSGGNVGIGTTSPVQKLDVNGNINLAKGYSLYAENHPVLRVDSNTSSIFLGNGTGRRTSGLNNIAIGTAALFSNTGGSHNVAIGPFALRSNTQGGVNVAVGGSALTTNTTGTYNTAMGYSSLLLNSGGHNNTAMGVYALYGNTTGSSNTAVGVQTLYSNNTGESNVALGSFASQYNTTGSYNTAAGPLALNKNTSGFYNTALGLHALSQSTTGNQNVAIGTYTLYGTDGAWANTAIGHGAGYSYNNGWNNTFVGASATAVSNGIFNSVALGNGSTVTRSNQVVIGNGNTNFIGGFVGWSNVSDGRVKRNIRENVPGLAFINKLKPVTYNLDLDAVDKIKPYPVAKDKGSIIVSREIAPEEMAARQAKQKAVYTGFVAQDVEKAAKELGYDFSGVDAAKNEKDLYSLRYSEFVVPLVKAVQELDAESKKLKEELAELRQMVLAPRNNNSLSHNPSSAALLEQNSPNPVATSTRIGYRVPSGSRAQLLLTNSEGKTVKVVSLNASGFVNLNAAGLSNGVYNYSLVVDGKTADTKRLTVSR